MPSPMTIKERLLKRAKESIGSANEILRGEKADEIIPQQVQAAAAQAAQAAAELNRLLGVMDIRD